MIYKNRIINISRDENIFLFGVRGSGKTALLKQLFPPFSPSTLYIDLLDESLYQSYISNIGLFYERVNTFKNDGLVIVDEIQKMPQLLNEVHRLIESSNRRFILTGSSARKIKSKGVNLLGGRAGHKFLHPFTPKELEKDFNLDQALRYGLLPIVWSSSNRGDKLKNYVETYLKEEIKAEALVRNLPAFSRFLEVASLCHGQTINISNIARDAQISRHFVRDFFSILEDTMLGFFLPAYELKLRIKQKKSSKFYLIDPGLTRTFKKNFGPVSIEEKGFLFEGLIAQILRAYGDYYNLYEDMYYWSSLESKTEVDFILKQGKELIAIEVKAKAQISSQDYRGLKAISKLANVKRRIVVYLGKIERKTKEGIEIWPFDVFCENLIENFESSFEYRNKKSESFPSTKDSLFLDSKLKPSECQIPPPENEEKFEDLCLDLYRTEFGDKTQKNGTQGQSQNGVDIFVPDQHIGIQCKKRKFNKKILESELKEEVEKAKNFQPALKRFILATTCKRDVNIQKIARLISEDHKKQNFFSVEIHSWDEIKALFDRHPKIYERYYRHHLSPHEITDSTTMRSIQSESRHEALNKIRDLIDKNKPKIALEQLEDFKKEKWEQLESKEKYRVLTNMASARMQMRQEIQASELLVKAWQFNQGDENANVNCALAYLIIGDIESSKKYIDKTRQINPLNITAYILEIKIKDKDSQSLEDIISVIPQSIQIRHQIALVLSQISMERKQYTEAKKWLDIFYKTKEKNKNWKNVMDEAGYADVYLSLILAKKGVFSGRRIPDILKDKLKEIINIYKKLVTESELKEFYPNWHLNYALALELEGDLDSAISILQMGIQYFPNNDHFKIELSRLFGQKGDITKSISILEKLLGLRSITSKDALSSVDKEILKESFNLTLILIDLYFQSNQSDKAYALLDKVVKISSISKEDRLEAKQYQIFRLINFGKIDEAEKILTPLFEEDRDNIFTLILKSKIEGAKEKAIRMEGKEFKDYRDKKIQYLKKACSIFNDKQYNEEENQKTLYFESKERLKDIQHLSQELYHSKMYKEVEPLLEEITNKNINHPEIFKLLNTYFENGQNRLAVELSEALLKKFPDRIESVNTLFLIYESLGNKKKAIQYYKNFLKLNPKNDFIRIELALAYIRSEHFLKAKELLKTSFVLERLSTEQMNILSIAYMRIGDVKKALETQYKCIKKSPRELKPQIVYFDLFTFLDHPSLSDIPSLEKESKALKSDNKSFLHPKKVGSDCYVRIKDVEISEETEIVIEEDADIYNPDHKFSQMLFEKKEGDVILFNDKQYRIMEIKSKYVSKYQEIIKEAEKRFPSKLFLKSALVSKKPNIEEFSQVFKKIVPDISKQQEGLDEIFQFYNEGKATIGSIAKISGKHPIEIIVELIFSQKDKFISAIPIWENDQRIQEYLDNRNDILIDLSSLFVIHQIKIEKYIEESKFKLYICQSTLDSLKEYIHKTALHSKDGLLTLGFDKADNFGKSFVPAKIIKQNLNFWMEVKAWIEEYCQIKPISTDIVLSRGERHSKEKLFGKEFLDPLLATDDNSILLCEDAILRKLAEQEFSVSGVRLFDLIEYFERQVIIDNNQAIKFKAQLVRLNQTYIPINHNILLFLLKESDCSVNNNIGFQRALFFLSHVSYLPGVVNIIANFLIEINQMSFLSSYNKQVITKEVLDKASFGRRESSKRIAYQIIQLVQARTMLLPFLQDEICKYIIEWLKGKIY